MKVREIHCAACENTITTALGKLPGVAPVAPSAQRNEVRVNFDDAVVSEQQLRATLAEVGYEPIG